MCDRDGILFNISGNKRLGVFSDFSSNWGEYIPRPRWQEWSSKVHRSVFTKQRLQVWPPDWADHRDVDLPILRGHRNHPGMVRTDISCSPTPRFSQCLQGQSGSLGCWTFFYNAGVPSQSKVTKCLEHVPYRRYLRYICFSLKRPWIKGPMICGMNIVITSQSKGVCLGGCYSWGCQFRLSERILRFTWTRDSH